MLVKILILLSALIGLLLLSRVLNRFLDEFARARKVPLVRVFFIRKLINILMIVVVVMVCCFILGLGYQQLFIFLSSVLAVVGIALFAQWSILSHLTAGMIIFFGFPYKVGDTVKVVDSDEDISGEIVEVASFHVLILRQDGSTVTYPNSALLQKPVIKLVAKNTVETEEQLKINEPVEPGNQL